MSVCLSACISAVPIGWISVEFDIGGFYKICRETSNLGRTKQSGTLHGHVSTFYCCRRRKFDIKALLYKPQYFTLLVVTCNSAIHVINALLRFCLKNGYTNTPECDILRTLQISSKVKCGLEGVKLQNSEKETIKLVNVRVRLVPLCVQIVHAKSVAVTNGVKL